MLGVATTTPVLQNASFLPPFRNLSQIVIVALSLQVRDPMKLWLTIALVFVIY